MDRWVSMGVLYIFITVLLQREKKGIGLPYWRLRGQQVSHSMVHWRSPSHVEWRMQVRVWNRGQMSPKLQTGVSTPTKGLTCAKIFQKCWKLDVWYISKPLSFQGVSAPELEFRGSTHSFPSFETKWSQTLLIQSSTIQAHYNTTRWTTVTCFFYQKNDQNVGNHFLRFTG